MNLSHTLQQCLGLQPDLQYIEQWQRVLHIHFCNKNHDEMLLILMHSCWKKKKKKRQFLEGMLLGFFSVKHGDFPDCNALEQNNITLSIQLNAGVVDVWAGLWVALHHGTSRLVSSSTPKYKTPQTPNVWISGRS